MAQTVSVRHPHKRRKAERLTVIVVEVPPDWRPRSAHDKPPHYRLVDRAGRFPADLARQLLDDFNEAELVARRQGRPRLLWMVVMAAKLDAIRTRTARR